MIRRLLCAFLALMLVLPVLPHGQALTFSVLGDSISTYAGYSDNGDANATLTGSRLFYPRWGMTVQPEDTWWYQAAQALDLTLLVNNSWSGSCVLHAAYGADGAYVNRCVQLHTDAGEEPDIIAVYLGTNDYYGYPHTLGSFAELDFPPPEDPKTTLEAYARMLERIRQRYPDEEIYCFTLLPQVSTGVQPTRFNEDLRAVAEHYGCVVVDLENCGIIPDPAVFYGYMGDALHPEKAGMDAITAAFVTAFLEHSPHAPEAHTLNTGGLRTSWGTGRLLAQGQPLELLLLNPPQAITVTMGDVDITGLCLDGGQVRIARVLGDIRITEGSPQTVPVPDPVPAFLNPVLFIVA